MDSMYKILETMTPELFYEYNIHKEEMRNIKKNKLHTT